MSVTDRHSLTQNIEMFALCISQTAKQIDGFCTGGRGTKTERGARRRRRPPRPTAFAGHFRSKNAAEIGYQQTRANRLDSLEIAIASAEKGESTRFSCSSFCAVGIRRCSSSSRVDWTPFCRKMRPPGFEIQPRELRFFGGICRLSDEMSIDLVP